jgi:hypothetical protein
VWVTVTVAGGWGAGCWVFLLEKKDILLVQARKDDMVEF